MKRLSQLSLAAFFIGMATFAHSQQPDISTATNLKQEIARAYGEYVSSLEDLTYHARGEVTSSAAGVFAWEFEYTARGDQYRFKYRQLPSERSTLSYQEETVAKNEEHMQFFDGERLRVYSLRSRVDASVPKTALVYANSCSSLYAAMFLPWSPIAENLGLDINLLSEWQNFDILTALDAAESIIVTENEVSRVIKARFPSQPGLFEGSIMHYEIEFVPGQSFPARWSLKSAEGGGVEYRVEEIGSTPKARGELSYPRKATRIVTVGDGDVISKTTIVMKIGESGLVTPAEFSIDPSLAKDIIDLDTGVHIVIPK